MSKVCEHVLSEGVIMDVSTLGRVPVVAGS